MLTFCTAIHARSTCCKDNFCNAPEAGEVEVNGETVRMRATQPWVLQHVDEHGEFTVPHHNGSCAVIVPKFLVLSAAALVFVLKMLV